jgi:hypothetical protein
VVAGTGPPCIASRKFWEVLARSYRGLGTYSETVHRLTTVTSKKSIILTTTETGNALRLFSTNKTDDYEPTRFKADSYLRTAWQLYQKEKVADKPIFVKSMNEINVKQNNRDKLVQGQGLASPAVMALFINVGAFDMGEDKAGGKYLASCYFSQPKVNNREINSEMYRKIYSDEKDEGVSLVDTCMGNRSDDKSQSVGLAGSTYVLHPYCIATTNAGYEDNDPRRVRSVNGYFPASMVLCGDPSARAITEEEISELYRTLFDIVPEKEESEKKVTAEDKAAEDKAEEDALHATRRTLFLLLELVNKICLDYGGLATCGQWASLYWKLRQISDTDSSSPNATNGNKDCPSDTPKYVDDLMFQTRLLFNSITKIRFAFLDGMGRMEACLSTMMMRQPERTSADLLELNRCSIPWRSVTKKTPYGVIGSVSSCIVVLHKNSRPGQEYTKENLSDFERFSASIQKDASESQNRGYVDTLSRIIDDIISAGLPRPPFDLSNRKINGKNNHAGDSAGFAFPATETSPKSAVDQFAKLHKTFVETISAERSGVGFDQYKIVQDKTITAMKSEGITEPSIIEVSERTCKSIIETLEDNYHCVFTQSSMKNTPCSLYTLAVMITDFCYDKKSTENMRKFVVRGGLKEAKLPAEWGAHGTDEVSLMEEHAIRITVNDRP